MAHGTVIIHRFQDPDSTKQMNDKWKGLLPPGPYCGFNVEVATAAGMATFAIKGAADGHGGFYSSMMIGNGIMAYDPDEIVDVISIAVGSVPTPGYLVFTVEWSESPTLAGTYEVIAQAAFDDRKHVILADVWVVAGTAYVKSRRLLDKAWPLSRLGGLFDTDAARVILDWDFAEKTGQVMPDAVITQVEGARVLPHGVEGKLWPGGTAWCELTVWAELSGAPNPADAVMMHSNLYRNEGTFEDHVVVSGAYDISAHANGEWFKLVDGVDMSGVFSYTGVGEPTAGQVVRVRVRREGTAGGDTYGGAIIVRAAYIEFKVKQIGASV